MRKILKKDGKVIIGDIMFFFNPNKEPKKLAFIKKIIERLFPNSAYSLISALNNEHPSQTKDLKLLFEKNGFCTKVKMFLPILGIIYAVHKRF
jgi:predicted metal-dependent enzyme (double-stranded beta helix superfamily)